MLGALGKMIISGLKVDGNMTDKWEVYKVKSPSNKERPIHTTMGKKIILICY